jgi:hypothetical protein
MLAFFTCYLGPDLSWSNIIHSPPSESHDCYYFTNNQNTYANLKDTGWIPVWLDIPIEDSEIKNCLNTKLLRCCPHLFDMLAKYEYLCYLDSKLWITDLDKVMQLQDVLASSETMTMAVSMHPRTYSSVWGEFDEAMQQARYKNYEKQYTDYIQHQLQSGYQDVPLRHCCGFSVRKQTEQMRRIGERWYSHIHRCGIEDQISWQFIIQDFPDAVYEVPYKYCWNSI